MSTSLLERALAPGGLSMRFQPIIDLSSGLPFGFESLTRGPRGTLFESAGLLFDYVRAKGAEHEVDRACVSLAIAHAAKLPAGSRISVNVHAASIGRDHGFVEFVQRQAQDHGFELHNLIVEIVEHAPPYHQPSFISALSELRQSGIAIALDDVGQGDSNYKMILDLQPNIFKIDGYIVSRVHADRSRQAVLRSIVRLAEDLGALSIAEGIEEIEELRAVRELGVHLVQGYLLAKPCPVDEILGTLFALDQNPGAGAPALFLQ